MKQKLLVLLLAAALLLSGCSWMDGSYVYISRHQEQRPSSQGGSVTVSGFVELQEVMHRMMENGVRKNVIFLSDYSQEMAASGMTAIRQDMLSVNPLGCYALEDILFEVGTNSGKPAIAVELIYRHTAAEIRQVHRFRDMDQAAKGVASALDDVKAGMVMLIRNYEELDFVQLVNDYALDHPQKVMEIPQVTEVLYGRGDSRLVELSFNYQTSRDALRQMRRQVEPVFQAAELYISKGGSDYQKYNQLYSFLMERFEYRIQSSITPSYSLLHHGVGDSRAFAVIYSAMCRNVGLPCEIITGTRDGEPWTWNLIYSHGQLVHLDLLRCSENGLFQVTKKENMTGYVWDYSAIEEACPVQPAAEVPTEPR